MRSKCSENLQEHEALLKQQLKRETENTATTPSLSLFIQ